MISLDVAGPKLQTTIYVRNQVVKGQASRQSIQPLNKIGRPNFQPQRKVPPTNFPPPRRVESRTTKTSSVCNIMLFKPITPGVAKL